MVCLLCFALKYALTNHGPEKTKSVSSINQEQANEHFPALYVRTWRFPALGPRCMINLIVAFAVMELNGLIT